MKESSVYIHVPYCASKCIYCDFYSGGASSARWEALVAAYIREFEDRRHELPGVPDTLYIGGGTPSLMPESHFERMVAGIRRIAGDVAQWREFTIEVNPDDVCKRKCEVWRDAGVNRVSMGVQSFVDSELKTIRRRHDSATAENAFRLLCEYFPNVSLDLMFGIPGQTMLSWTYSVRKAMDLRPGHLSAYSLMLEEGTPLTHLHDKGIIQLPDEEECTSMWRHLSEQLAKDGYEQYEISNYSLPGFRSVHNSRYWSGNPYIGIGPSAHSYDGVRTRRFNPADLRGYLSRYSEEGIPASGTGETPFFGEEILTDDELMEETILTRMRVKEGISLRDFGRDFGSLRLDRLLDNGRRLAAAGMVDMSDDCIRLSSAGVMLSDRVILELSS